MTTTGVKVTILNSHKRTAFLWLCVSLHMTLFFQLFFSKFRGDTIMGKRVMRCKWTENIHMRAQCEWTGNIPMTEEAELTSVLGASKCHVLLSSDTIMNSYPSESFPSSPAVPPPPPPLLVPLFARRWRFFTLGVSLALGDPPKWVKGGSKPLKFTTEKKKHCVYCAECFRNFTREVAPTKGIFTMRDSEVEREHRCRVPFYAL